MKVNLIRVFIVLVVFALVLQLVIGILRNMVIPYVYADNELSQVQSTTQVKVEPARDHIITVLNSHLKGRLENKGETIYVYAKANNLSASFVTAVIMQELGLNCSSNVFEQANNPCGINWNSQRYSQYPRYGRYVAFPDVDTGLWEMCKLLNECYISQGRTSTHLIGKKWAPTDDYEQGMYGMDNNSWPARVNGYYQLIFSEIYNDEF